MAKIEYEKAYQLMDKTSNKYNWLEACLSIARIHLVTSNYAKFNNYIQLAENTANELKSLEHLAAIIGKESREYLLSSYEKTAVNLLDLADAADDLGVKCLSVRLFGKELLSRSVAERMRVSGILADFFENALLNAVGSRGYKIRFLGEIRLVQIGRAHV